MTSTTQSKLEAARAAVASARAALHELIDRHGGRHLVPGLEYRGPATKECSPELNGIVEEERFFNKEVARLLYQLEKESRR